MRRKIAEGYNLSYICPLCQYLDKTEEGIINHLVFNHEDKEAYWNKGDIMQGFICPKCKKIIYRDTRCREYRGKKYIMSHCNEVGRTVKCYRKKMR